MKAMESEAKSYNESDLHKTFLLQFQLPGSSQDDFSAIVRVRIMSIPEVPLKNLFDISSLH
jgi:hypothetical protein